MLRQFGFHDSTLESITLQGDKLVLRTSGVEDFSPLSESRSEERYLSTIDLAFEGVADFVVDDKPAFSFELAAPSVEISSLDVSGDQVTMVLHLFWYLPLRILSKSVRFKFADLKYNILESTRELDDC